MLVVRRVLLCLCHPPSVPALPLSFSCLTLAVATVCLYPIFPVGFSLLVFEFPSVGFCHSDFPPFASLPKCVGGVCTRASGRPVDSTLRRRALQKASPFGKRAPRKRAPFSPPRTRPLTRAITESSRSPSSPDSTRPLIRRCCFDQLRLVLLRAKRPSSLPGRTTRSLAFCAVASRRACLSDARVGDGAQDGVELRRPSSSSIRLALLSSRLRDTRARLWQSRNPCHRHSCCRRVAAFWRGGNGPCPPSSRLVALLPCAPCASACVLPCPVDHAVLGPCRLQPARRPPHIHTGVLTLSACLSSLPFRSARLKHVRREPVEKGLVCVPGLVDRLSANAQLYALTARRSLQPRAPLWRAPLCARLVSTGLPAHPGAPLERASLPVRGLHARSLRNGRDRRVFARVPWVYPAIRRARLRALPPPVSPFTAVCPSGRQRPAPLRG